jgi:sugar lactone lactonase YvrE
MNYSARTTTTYGLRGDCSSVLPPTHYAHIVTARTTPRARCGGHVAKATLSPIGGCWHCEQHVTLEQRPFITAGEARTVNSTLNDLSTRPRPYLGCRNAAALLLIGLLLSSGCTAMRPEISILADPPADSEQIVWPQPPAPPRIRHIRSVERPIDFGIRRSWWQRAASFITGGGKLTERFVKPMGVTFDEEDNPCLTDAGSGRVWYFDLDKGSSHAWQKVGKVSFIMPVGVAKRNGVLYVADSVLKQVVAFDERGRVHFRTKYPMERPAGLALLDDRVLVVDAKAHRVLVFDLQGGFVHAFGVRGTGLGELNFPTHITVDADKHIYVTDAMNFRVQVFDGDGRPLRSFGSIGDVSGSFSRPKGIAVDARNNVYVCDALFDTIQVFDSAGGFMLNWGRTGSGPDGFWLPTGICIGSKQHILVADSYNARVQVFQYIGTEQRQ